MIESKNGTANSCPIVFIHGFLEDNEMWNFVLADNSIKNPIYLVELAGHGNSTFQLRDSLAEMAGDIHLALLKEGLSSCKLVGHSLGGYIGLELLKKHPHFYKHVVLLNSHPLADSDQKKIERSRVVDVVAKNKDLFIKTAIPNLFLNETQAQTEIDFLVASAMKMHAKAIQYCTNAMRDREDNKVLFNALSSQITVIYGEHDKLVPLSRIQDELKGYLDNFFIINGGGHMCHIESREETTKLLKEILERDLSINKRS